jgi:ANTAR domain-containing protein
MTENGSNDAGAQEDVVVRKAERGWVVGEENVSDLTSAMVLADLFAADQAVNGEAALLENKQAVDAEGEPGRPSGPPRPRHNDDSGPLPAVPNLNEPKEAERLAVTVVQLEHALASRVRVEQAIGVLAERYRLHPREAFDLLRGAARSRGSRVTDIAQDVVASAANPLVRLPDELTRPRPESRPRTGRSARRGRHAADR